MGLRSSSVISLATSMNCRPKLSSSMYIRITPVLGSEPRYRSMSSSLTSALLPMLMNLEKPSPRERAASRIDRQSAPDWLMSATRPCWGIGRVANIPCICTSGSVLMIPTQFGPTSGTPAPCTISSNVSSYSAPCGPASLKPPDRTSSERTLPASMPWRAVSGTLAAGTSRMARSTGSGS